MALYFFHLCDGSDVLIDPDGREIADPDDVARHALREARWCISQEVLEGRLDLTQAIEVRDDKGELVFSQPFGDAVTMRR